MSTGVLTLLLVLFGVGMTAGNLVGARLADHNLMHALYLALTSESVIAVLFVFTDRNQVTAAIWIVLFAFTAMAIIPAVQSRLITLADEAPNLAAASMHSAFNVANSIGAWLGGLTIAAGNGYSSPNLVAAGLAVLGLGIALYAGAGSAAQNSRRPGITSSAPRAVQNNERQPPTQMPPRGWIQRPDFKTHASRLHNGWAAAWNWPCAQSAYGSICALDRR